MLRAGFLGSASGKTIASLATISNYNVPFNTAYGTNGAGISLPSTVTATFHQGGTAAIPIVWSIGSYSPLAAFEDDITYTMNGTLTLPSGVRNPANLQPSVQVTVKDAFFPLTSNVKWYVLSDGLVASTNNSYGNLTGTGVQSWKSRAPGPTGVDFNKVSTAPTLTSGRIPFTDADANDMLEQATLTSAFDFMYVGTHPKWTAFMICTINDIEAHWQGIFGNNGIYDPSGGMSIFANTGSTNLQLCISVSNSAGGGQSVTSWFCPGVISIGNEKLYTLTYDHNLANNAGRCRGWTNTTEASSTNATGTATPMTVQTSTKFQIGDVGSGGGADMDGSFRLMVLLDGTESDAVRLKFQQDLIAKFSIS